VTTLPLTGESPGARSEDQQHSGDDSCSHGSSGGIRLGLFGAGGAEEDYGEEDDLEKEFEHIDDQELLDYQRSRSTPKIIVQEFEGEDERSA
jgi:hypothetical protein